MIFLKIEKFVVPKTEKVENAEIQTGIFKQQGPANLKNCRSLK